MLSLMYFRALLAFLVSRCDSLFSSSSSLSPLSLLLTALLSVAISPPTPLTWLEEDAIANALPLSPSGYPVRPEMSPLTTPLGVGGGLSETRTSFSPRPPPQAPRRSFNSVQMYRLSTREQDATTPPSASKDSHTLEPSGVGQSNYPVTPWMCETIAQNPLSSVKRDVSMR